MRAIMKRQSRKKLTLDRTTIATLSSKELKDAVGGALPPTRETHCGTECEPTNFCL
jgi:natural product precursor